MVGNQGVTNLGVGRADASGLSGFVFSAASDSFNLLVRALKTQGRVDILSRPQVMTLDNQTATINIGQQIPICRATLLAGGLSQKASNDVIVGVNLTVTPRISPDGTVLMRVTPSVSSVAPVPEQLGNGITSAIFNVQQVDTTVQAMDGETVAIGGLITKNERKTENKIPVLGDLPFLGALFRYRTQTRTKTELLVIMTPHVVRSKADIERVLGEETHRMDWIMGDVLRTHGTYGMDPAIPKKNGPGAGGPDAGGPGVDGGAYPPVPGALPGVAPGANPEGPAPIPEPLTQPRIAPPSNLPPMQPMPGPGQPQAYMPSLPQQQVAGNNQQYANSGANYSQAGADAAAWSNPQSQQGYAAQSQMPAGPAKENRGWIPSSNSYYRQ